MKLYIAGKMTGDPDYKSKFDAAAEKLTAKGHIVLNPAWQPQGLTSAEYMRIALTMLDVAEAAVFLPDWRESEGAKVERAYCQRTDKQIIEWTDINAAVRNCECCAFYEDGHCCQPLGAELMEEQYINVSPDDYCSAWELGF